MTTPALRRSLLPLLLGILYSLQSAAQGTALERSAATLVPTPSQFSVDSSLTKARLWPVGVAHVGLYTGSLLILNQAWYKNYPTMPFHSFDDSREWLQVDKIGHAWSSYGLSRSSSAAWKWTGMTERKAAIWGGLCGFGFLTAIEILDGRSGKWGWSWSDMGANVSGTALFLSQQLAWHEQRMLLKFSFHQKHYSPNDLNERANELFGNAWYERLLKDYNSQTYWLSANIGSFIKNDKMPKWLNIAMGYGANGLFGGFENKSVDASGLVTFDRRDVPRVRQFYIAPDIDFQRLGFRSKWMRTLGFILNGFKLPAPALMLDSKGKLRGYWLYF